MKKTELKRNTNFYLDYAMLRNAVLVLRAINHKLRQRIVDLLQENDSMNVTDIYIKLRLEQSVASQHLAILRNAKIVEDERQGQFVFYSLNYPRLLKITKVVKALAG